MSLPSRERGLKFKYFSAKSFLPAVAPFAGAWIEILAYIKMRTVKTVAPFAGAWIEISAAHTKSVAAEVAPFAGAWIEIPAFLPLC